MRSPESTLGMAKNATLATSTTAPCETRCISPVTLMKKGEHSRIGQILSSRPAVELRTAPTCADRERNPCKRTPVLLKAVSTSTQERHSCHAVPLRCNSGAKKKRMDIVLITYVRFGWKPYIV